MFSNQSSIAEAVLSLFMKEYDPSQAEIWLYNVNNDRLKFLTIEEAPTLTVWRLSVSHVFGILLPLPTSGINVSSGS